MLKLLDISEMLHNSKTQLIQFIDWEGGWKSPLNNFHTRLKKLQNYNKLGNELSIKYNTIYWPTNIPKKPTLSPDGIE